MKEIKTEYRSRLPHIVPVGATFFVTFRLADSLPQKEVYRLKQELENEILQTKKLNPKNLKDEIGKARKHFFKNFDHQLDEEPYGKCYLKLPPIAQIVKDQIHKMNACSYDLIAYTIMPNHVHLLIDTSKQLGDRIILTKEDIPEDYVQLFQILKRIKGTTAYKANKYLGRKGVFWQKDSYDHFVRDEREFGNIIAYILHNPVKARLVKKWQDFPHTFVKEMS